MKKATPNDAHSRQSNRAELFVEYFYTFGIDTDTAFSEYINFAKPFEENDNIKPKIINQFPLYPKQNSYIEPSVLMKHCFPNGFVPIEAVFHPKEELFHFTLDNLLHHDEYPKLYFTVLIIYESLTIYQQMNKVYDKVNHYNFNNKSLTRYSTNDLIYNENENDKVKNYELRQIN